MRFDEGGGGDECRPHTIHMPIKQQPRTQTSQVLARLSLLRSLGERTPICASVYRSITFAAVRFAR